MYLQRLSGFFCLSVWALSACAQTASDSDTRLVRLEQQVEQLKQVVLDQELKLSQQQEKLQVLLGEKEMLMHQIELVKKQQQDIFLDLDQRLRQKEKGTVVTKESTVVTTEPAQEVQPKIEVPPPVNEATTAEKTAPSEPPVAKAAEEQLYKQAFRSLQQGSYEQAANEFEQLLRQYPQGAYADTGQYWLGEANFALKKYNTALVNFSNLLEKYPNSAKLGHAQLKMGYAYYELKDYPQARSILEGVRDKYPGTATGRLAEERLQKMTNEGL